MLPQCSSSFKPRLIEQANEQGGTMKLDFNGDENLNLTNNLLGRLHPAPSLVVCCLSPNGSRHCQAAGRLPHASCGRPRSSRRPISCVCPSLCPFHTHLCSFGRKAGFYGEGARRLRVSFLFSVVPVVRRARGGAGRRALLPDARGPSFGGPSLPLPSEPTPRSRRTDGAGFNTSQCIHIVRQFYV